VQSAAYGSVFDTITTNTFKGITISLPEEENIIQFNESVTPYFFKILTNQTQIHTLTALRDTLLPKLMSGEVRVRQ
jgi:type I restriction enzyme S subunit